MEYLVQGHTFKGYYDKTSPEFFELLVDAPSKDAAKEVARSYMQNVKGHCAMVQYARDLPQMIVETEDDHSWVEQPWWECELWAFDVETTGFSYQNDRIVEIGFAKYEDKQFVKKGSFLINDGVSIPQELLDKKINDITNEMLEGKPSFSEAFEEFPDIFRPGVILVSYNRGFDIGHLSASIQRADKEAHLPPVVCPMEIAIRSNIDGKENNKLETLSRILLGSEDQSHRAEDDAVKAGNVLLALARRTEFFKRPLTARQFLDYFDHNPDLS